MNVPFRFIDWPPWLNRGLFTGMKATRDRIPNQPALRAKVVLPVCLFLGVMLLLGACSRGTSTIVSGGLTGVYTLVTVNGNPVPATISHDGIPLQIRSGSFTINAGGTCSSKMVFVPPSGAETVREVSATYTAEGMKLVMKWKGAGTTAGTVAGNTFTMNNEGMVLVYEK
jgi:hypothetical protein